MKYTKTLGLLAVAAAALMALAGTASATAITSSTGTTPTIGANSLHVVWEGAFTSVTCNRSEISATITGHGQGVPATGPISTLDFTDCNHPVTVEANGTLAITAATPTGNGTITWSGGKITIHTSVGTCVFTSNNTHIGTLTGSNNSGGNPVLDITGKVPRTGGNFLCGTSGQWTGNYTVTHPLSLEVH